MSLIDIFDEKGDIAIGILKHGLNYSKSILQFS